MQKNILKTELLKKWLNARKGRMTILAELLQRDKKSLYHTIFENRVSNDLYSAIERKRVEITELESECLQQFPKFVRFIRKGEGRLGRLSKKLEIPMGVLRSMAKAKKDGRYIMIKYGVPKIMAAISAIEHERKHLSYSHEKIDVKAFISEHVRKSVYTIRQVIQLADTVRECADKGNCDAAVICRVIDESKYRVLSIGFDTTFTDMCRSHVCDKDNPHIHAALFAVLNVPKKEREQLGSIMAFSHSAPCPECAKRLIDLGVSEIYCTLEPELMDGLNLLGDVGVPVYKYNNYDQSIRTINSIKKKVA